MNKFYGNSDAFSVRSSADLALGEIYLDNFGMSHIQLGHRSLTNVSQTIIRDAVERPTKVYQSAQNPNRFLFHSSNVTTGGGKPMMVVVEREESRGRVITASPNPNPKGQMIWESSGSIYSDYDRMSDILYVSKGAAADGYVSDEDSSIWFRSSENEDLPIGVTIFDLRALWAQNKDVLIERVATFLNSSRADIKVRVESALQMI